MSDESDSESGREESAASSAEAAGGLPRIDFSTFVLSLATSGLMHLGLTPEPETGQPAEPNLTLASQTIDTLQMLQEKTVGNLGDEEEKLLQSVLYELRMAFVKAKG